MRGLFRSTWFSTAVVVWYALVAMPALPSIQLGGGSRTNGDSCQVVCTCSSCSGGDACCCAPPAGDDSLAPVFHEEDLKGSVWKPIDCAKKAAWMTGLKAPTVPSAGSVEPMALNTTARVCVVDEQAMPADPIGVPEPPPRLFA